MGLSGTAEVAPWGEIELQKAFTLLVHLGKSFTFRQMKLQNLIRCSVRLRKRKKSPRYIRGGDGSSGHKGNERFYGPLN